MKIKFDKLYRYDRKMEHCCIAIPIKKGKIWSSENVRIKDGDKTLPSQTKATSRYQDGSVRWLFTRFMVDLPGNAGKELNCEPDGGEQNSGKQNDIGHNDNELHKREGIRARQHLDCWHVDCGSLKFILQNQSGHLFKQLEDGNRIYRAEQFTGPLLKTPDGEYDIAFGDWEAVENGSICVILQAEGSFAKEHVSEKEAMRFVCRITACYGKPWLDISFRLINATDREQHIVSWVFALKRDVESVYEPVVECTQENGETAEDIAWGAGRLYQTTGISELSRIQEEIELSSVRTCAGRSNYKTFFSIGSHGRRVGEVADAALLVNEANEHFAEVFYGTFFGDMTDERGGVCATIFQAQQNYPKAVSVDGSGIYVMLVPEGVDKVVMASGMAREQRFQLHFHSPEETLQEIDNRSLIYQMPDCPFLMPEVYEEAGVMPDIFLSADKMDMDVEIALVNRADSHARCYGMMNWGDAPDMGYTNQGRGGGRLVWTNNEYDYPHAMYLLYARNGERRFLDYANVAASHWMDVDVCHYSAEPLYLGGQWEHTHGHCRGGVMVCSHQWVEGLLDYYHFTGNERALETAVGIGENVLRLLELPMYQKSGESSARETGWALRTLTALYLETWDEKWTQKLRWIVGQFREWAEEYGVWVSPYTDNTSVRVGFMIAIAVGSLMRYYRAFPQEEVKQLVLNAVDDLVENCLMANGLFYYKELPSLKRNGSGALMLEALAGAYELTGDKKYLEYGRKTFEYTIKGNSSYIGGGKKIVEDAVISGSGGTKSFAQSFIPLAVYYKALREAE